MAYVRIELLYRDKRQGGYIDKIENVVLSDLMAGREIEESLKISKVANMTEEEFAALPEFTGF